jgi:1,5-anhydro-D-fructose reductase (1,5-anhydro-D-mannitol-forming)
MQSTMMSRLAVLPLLFNLMGVILSVNAMNMNLPASTGSTGIPTAPSPGKVVRWGIIGLGDVVKHQTAPAFLQAEDSDLVAVCGSRTPGKAASWAAENGGPNCRGYNHLEDFLADDRIDAYYIATPPGQHVYMAMKVANTIVKADNAGAAVYIEKPVGRSYEETATISASLQARGIPLYTAYTSRAYPRTVAVKDLLESGRIGQVVNITYRLSGLDASTLNTGTGRVQDGGLDKEKEPSKSRTLPWRLQADVSGGGLFVDVGCHLLDRLDFIAGPLLNVRGQALNRQSPGQDVEDYVWLQARIGSQSSDSDSENDEPNFCAGADVDCIFDFTFTPPDSSDNNDQQLTDELVFQGTKGSLQMKGMSPDAPVRVLYEDGSLVEELVFESTSLAAGSGSLPLIQTITNELLGKGQGGDERDGQCQSKSFNAMRTSAVMDTVLKEYYGGRGDDFFHRPESWPGIPPSRRELYLAELRS